MIEINRQEILYIAETVAREKGLKKDEVLEAIELAVQKVARTKYGPENDIRATVDRHTGQIQLVRFFKIVNQICDPQVEILQQEALLKNPAHIVEDFFCEPLPPLNFGRVAAQAAKQVIVQKVRDLEREHQYHDFKDRIGELVNGLVKRVEFGNVTLELGKAEGLLRRDELLPREAFRPGDRVRAYVQDVRRETKGPQIFLSRRHPQFMAKLFTQEVPEIYDGVIEIKAVARDPGSRAKIAVYSKDSSVDPVGSCVGMRGSRVQAVVQELQGEKVDIIPWSPDIATLIANALAPAEISKIVLGQDEKRVEVVVPEDQLSLAIGRKGQNVRLASELTKISIDIILEEEDCKKRNLEAAARSELFMKSLDVDEVIAHLLVTEGFEKIEDIAHVEKEELLDLEGFTPDIVQELQNRALQFLEKTRDELLRSYKDLGGTQELIELKEISPHVLVELAQNEITTRDALGALSGEELKDLLQKNPLNTEEANKIVMAARAHWFVQTPADKEKRYE